MKRTKSVEEQGLESEGPSLMFSRYQQVTFRLSRRENPEDFERMSFVIRVCLKNVDCSFKTIIHVEEIETGSRIVSSDGFRVHIAQISKRIKSGDYNTHVTKDTISLGEPVEGIVLPKWFNEIPDNVEKRGEINLKKSGLGKSLEQMEKLSVAYYMLIKQIGQPINLLYLTDLTKREWTVYSQDIRLRPIVLRQKPEKTDGAEEEGPIAIIMPLGVSD